MTLISTSISTLAEGGLNLEVEAARLRHAGGVAFEIEVYLVTEINGFATFLLFLPTIK